MTTDADPAQVNGTAPQPGEPAEPGAGGESSPAERVMGVLAIIAAAGLLAIGLDMATGGALFPALARLFGAAGDEQG